MGLYDRDYAREATRGGGLRGLVATWTYTHYLIALNVLVFILWLAARDSFSVLSFMVEHFMVSRDALVDRYFVHTLFTSAFSHMEPFHLLFNMWCLWMFGPELEVIYGRRNYLMLYLLCGAAASLAHVALAANPALGASGAVVGIMIVTAILFPDRQILIFFVIPMTMRLAAILLIVVEVLGLVREPDGIAHGAHLGGAAMGALFWKLDLRFFKDTPTGKRGLLARFLGFFKPRPKLRVIRRGEFEDVEAPEPQDRGRAEPSLDSGTAARVDALLAKISREGGLGALTDEEREFLRHSSEKYRR
ncbi:MAG: rhomboid family intramembrane serine protease [Planctomycetota bacterium]|nr:rhomboid family intramembrane serine protease [Planctomycetota bacterium]